MLFMQYVKKEDILDTSDATATAGDIAKGKTAYVNGIKLEGESESNSTMVNEISGGDVTSKLSMLYKYIKRIDVPLKIGVTSSAVYAFQNCESLENIDLDVNNTQRMDYCFKGCKNLKEVTIYNTSKCTLFNSCFNQCDTLETAPEMDTSLGTNFSYFLGGCDNLKNVPVYNLAKATNLSNMFTLCPLLTDESLNNILASCITTASYTGTKTLATMGISSEQATKCQSLSNYQAFVNAGWSTGY